MQCDPRPTLYANPMLTHVSHPRTGTPENIESIIARGRALWDSIYEPHADKLHDKLGSYHPDFIGEFLMPREDAIRIWCLVTRSRSVNNWFDSEANSLISVHYPKLRLSPGTFATRKPGTRKSQPNSRFCRR